MSMHDQDLTPREREVLTAVVRTFVATATPAGSRTVARTFDLGVSPATIRNTMADLAMKGYLSQPHPSAGRTPTDKAYRYYVDSVMQVRSPTLDETVKLEARVAADSVTAEELLSRAVQALSVVTVELGVGVGPAAEREVLERIDLVALSSERLLIVLTLDAGPVRTIYVEVPRPVSEAALSSTAAFLNERLAGLTLGEVRETYRDRLSGGSLDDGELLNIFLEKAETAFSSRAAADLVLGPTSSIADQPEFADRDNLRSLIELTEQKDILAQALKERQTDGIVISIGGEHPEPLLDFSLVTTRYRMGDVEGTIGVMGPTRMPYERVVALVEYTAELLSLSRPGA